MAPANVETPRLSVESLSDDIVQAYARFGLMRAKGGAPLIDWTFQPPGSIDGPSPFCLARSASAICGLSSYIPQQILLNGETGVARQAVDSFVAASGRGKGLFTRLAQHYAGEAERHSVDVLWGFPNKNAARIWFDRLGWENFGQVPFLIRPLRAGYVFRKLRLPGDVNLTRSAPAFGEEIDHVGQWYDAIWQTFIAAVPCAVVRDRASLTRRFLSNPSRGSYRLAAVPKATDPAFVATRVEQRHGARIAYFMEALGGAALPKLLRAELRVMASKGAEMALAWCFPWSPNYRAYRSAGFRPLPTWLRPVEINFGATAYTPRGQAALTKENWYLSYYDSDGL